MNRAWMLGNRGQKMLKWLHLTFVAFCLGGLLSMLVLSLLKNEIRTENPYLIDLAIYRLFNIVVNNSFYAVLITAFIYALFTNWGFFRHRWIATKWFGVLLLFIYVWFWMAPAISGMVSLADGGFVLSGTRDEYLAYVQQSRFLILIAGLVFILIVFISIFKPWGMRKRQLFKVNRKVQFIVVGTILMFMLASLVMMSVSLEQYRKMKIADSDLSILTDGKYHGKATIGGFTYEVGAIIENHKIIDLKVTKNRSSAYARFAEGVIPRILEKQNANVDAITGATTTSKVLMKAVENAFSDSRN